MIELRGRSKQKEVVSEPGLTILELALKSGVDFGFNCTRGNCARCRCYIGEGMERLLPPNEAEQIRLEPEEIEEGFRLGCQARIKEEGYVRVTHKPYF